MTKREILEQLTPLNVGVEYAELDPEFKKDPEIALAAVISDSRNLFSVPSELKKSVILELVDKEDSGIYYEDLISAEKMDADIVKHAAKQNPFALGYYQSEYNKLTPEFLQNILDFPPFDGFSYEGNVLTDANYMLEIIAEQESAFQYCDSQLREDDAFIKEAIAANLGVSQELPEAKRHDPEIAKYIVEQAVERFKETDCSYSTIMDTFPQAILNDPTFIIEANKLEPYDLDMIPQEMLQKEYAVELLKNNHSLLSFLEPKLWGDEDIMKAMAEDPKIGSTEKARAYAIDIFLDENEPQKREIANAMHISRKDFFADLPIEQQNFIDKIAKYPWKINELPTDLNNIDSIASICQNIPESYTFIKDNDIHANKEVVLAAVRGDGRLFEEVPSQYAMDRDVVLTAAQTYGHTLEWCDPSIRNDFEIAQAATQNAPEMMELLSNDMQKKLIDQDISLLAYGSPEMEMTFQGCLSVKTAVELNLISKQDFEALQQNNNAPVDFNKVLEWESQWFKDHGIEITQDIEHGQNEHEVEVDIGNR